MSETKTAKRPMKTDDDVMAEVAKAILPDVMKWGEFKSEDENDILMDLTTALQDSRDLDSFKIGKVIEDDYSWGVDSGLVDILERVESLAHETAKAKVKQWVIDNAIEPPYGPGVRVRWWNGSKFSVGTIVAVRHDEATYVIQEDGKTYPPVSKDGFHCGWIIAYENTIPLD